MQRICESLTPTDAEHFTARAIAALQFLDERGGPDDPELYAAVMRAIALHCERSAQRALLAGVGRA
jgi:hypothetical protein